MRPLLMYAHRATIITHAREKLVINRVWECVERAHTRGTRLDAQTRDAYAESEIQNVQSKSVTLGW